MKIEDLISRQEKQTEQAQLSYQAILKKHLKRNGLDRNKDPDLKKDLEKHARKITNKALGLGIEWLET
ncbi:MAG: hypothetical protein U5N26_06940 [Candidatus Marinimicrobia bacterium]|nr:hypothetical protein [Candidatus Neomarinimicrobiota bacterium]